MICHGNSPFAAWAPPTMRQSGSVADDRPQLVGRSTPNATLRDRQTNANDFTVWNISLLSGSGLELISYLSFRRIYGKEFLWEVSTWMVRCLIVRYSLDYNSCMITGKFSITLVSYLGRALSSGKWSVITRGTWHRYCVTSTNITLVPISFFAIESKIKKHLKRLTLPLSRHGQGGYSQNTLLEEKILENIPPSFRAGEARQQYFGDFSGKFRGFWIFWDFSGSIMIKN